MIFHQLLRRRIRVSALNQQIQVVVRVLGRKQPIEEIKKTSILPVTSAFKVHEQAIVFPLVGPEEESPRIRTINGIGT